MTDLIFSNKDFSNIIDGNNFNTIETSDNYNLVLLSNYNSINFVTKDNDKYKNNLQIKNNNISINSNLKLSGNCSINNININSFNSEDNNVSSGTMIKSNINSSLFLGIDGDDYNDSLNVLFNKNNLYHNLLCIKHNGVGIKNSDPQSELDINGCIKTKELYIKNDDNSSIRFNQNNNLKLGIFLENNSLEFRNNQDNLLNLVHDGEYKGNLGIGTDTPSTKLDINGSSIRIREETLIEPDIDTIGSVGEIRWSKNAIFILTEIDENKYLWKKANLLDII